VKFGITGNLDKKEIPGLVRELIAVMRSHQVDFVLDGKLSRLLQVQFKKEGLKKIASIPEERLPFECDILVSLGGDGTILRAARLIGKHETPILAVNVGKLGFLAEVSQDEAAECLEEILGGKYKIEDRMMLEGSSNGFKSTYAALNDIVIEKYSTSRVLTIETYVNDEYLATYTADGIIIATPTGSTAYSLANSGPIVTPSSAAITINPICPHTLTARPVIVPSNSALVVKLPIAGQKLNLSADGQQAELLTSPASIQVRQAPYVARLVKRLNSSYYDVLRKKLHWGSDVRIHSKAKQ